MGGIVAAFADLFTAGAVMTGAEIATVVGVTGAGLSVVGAVTGNKTLSTIGSVMGIAGAVGGLTGGFDSLSGAFTDSTSAASVAAQNTSFGAAAADGSFATPATTASTDLTAFNPYGTTAGTNILGSTTPYDAMLNPTVGAPFNGSQVLTGGPATTAASSAGWMDAIKNADPLVKYGMMQMAGSGLAGLSSAYTAQQKLAMEQQQQDWAHQAYLTSVANANSQPTINMPSVNTLRIQAAQPAATPMATPAAQPVSSGLISAVGSPTTIQ